jgi:hypothetical protein
VLHRTAPHLSAWHGIASFCMALHRTASHCIALHRTAGHISSYSDPLLFFNLLSILIYLASSPLPSPLPILSFNASRLLCVFDTAVSTEEDAVVSILNTECPIRKFGYFGAQHEGVYAMSTIETQTVWHYPSAQRIAHFPQVCVLFCKVH